jgi:hypothetical protein
VPTISIFFGIMIEMFFNEHAPPHFHASYGEHEATIDIKKLEVMEGNLPRRAKNLVLEWTELHQAALLSNWDKCRAGQLPDKIAPLE